MVSSYHYFAQFQELFPCYWYTSTILMNTLWISSLSLQCINSIISINPTLNNYFNSKPSFVFQGLLMFTSLNMAISLIAMLKLLKLWRVLSPSQRDLGLILTCPWLVITHPSYRHPVSPMQGSILKFEANFSYLPWEVIYSYVMFSYAF